MRSEENVSSEISFKQRELERAKISLKQLFREEEDLEGDIGDLKENIDEKHGLFEKKKHQEEELSRKFQKLISERDNFGKRIRENEIQITSKQQIIQGLEQIINNFKIEKAKTGAIIENLEIEMLAY